MALLTGSIRLRRYMVTGELPKDLRNSFEESISKHAFKEFAETDFREEAVGWVTIDDEFDTNLSPDRWLIEDSINITLRIDVKKVPARILAYECKKAELEKKEREARDKLSRHEREEIKESVKVHLAKRVLPSIRTIDVSWDLKREEVLLFATADGVAETFRTLFEKTFNVSLRPLFPYALADSVLGGVKEADKVTAARFIGGGE